MVQTTEHNAMQIITHSTMLKRLPEYDDDHTICTLTTAESFGSCDSIIPDFSEEFFESCSNDVSLSTKESRELWNMELDDVIAQAESLANSHQDATKQKLAIIQEKQLQPSTRSAECPVSILSSAKTKKITKKKNSVAFDKIQVRVYERILDVNPECSNGPSLGIGWRYQPLETMKVDFWEIYRIGNRRMGSNLVMSKTKREKIAKKNGHSEAEIVDNARAVRLTKQQRLCTVNNLHMQKMELAVEISRKKLSKMFSANRTRGSF